jgi:hypothetical protein
MIICVKDLDSYKIIVDESNSSIFFIKVFPEKEDRTKQVKKIVMPDGYTFVWLSFSSFWSEITIQAPKSITTVEDFLATDGTIEISFE